MKIFIDTANIEEIREAASWGVLDGVTTNLSLIAKEGRDFIEALNIIKDLVDGPISAEVMSDDAEGMVGEARELVKIDSNIVIKIPMTEEGIKAVAQLHKEGIKTNVTLVFSANQALLAAKAGASYVSPFVGRIDDMGNDGMNVVREIMEIFNVYGIDTEVIAASIRHSMHVIECAKAGADIATIPYGVLKKMFHHPLTDLGVERFKKDWSSLK